MATPQASMATLSEEAKKNGGLDHLLYGQRKRLQAVLAHPKDLFRIDVEVVMGDDVAEALHARPVDLGMLWEK
jgi:hypothetical protein